MTRETRYNLIFLAVLLAVTVPGAVMLFRKKLEPTLRPMYLPDPVRRSVAYMSPQEVPPGMSRVAPAHTADWVKGEAEQFAGAAAAEKFAGAASPRPRDAEGLPVMSAARQFEVVTYMSGGDGFRVMVVFWSPRELPLDGKGTWSLDEERGTVEQTREVELPRLVREELGANGVLIPPKSVVVEVVRFAKPASGKRTLTWHSARGGADAAEIVTSFTNPAVTSN